MKVTRDRWIKTCAAHMPLAGLSHAPSTRDGSLCSCSVPAGPSCGEKSIRGLACQERHIPSGYGGPPIRVSIYRPTAAVGPLPVMLYLHGGGYVHGVPEQFGAAIRT